MTLSEDGYVLVAEDRARCTDDSDKCAGVISVDKHTVTAKKLGKATMHLSHQSILNVNTYPQNSDTLFAADIHYSAEKNTFKNQLLGYRGPIGKGNFLIFPHLCLPDDLAGLTASIPT